MLKGYRGETDSFDAAEVGVSFALQNIHCRGDEDSLANCQHEKVYECDIKQIANVKCLPNIGMHKIS